MTVSNESKFAIPEYMFSDMVGELVESGAPHEQIREIIEGEMKNAGKYAEELLPLCLMGLVAGKHLKDTKLALEIFDRAWSMAKCPSDMLMSIEFLSWIEVEDMPCRLKSKLLVAAETCAIEKDMMGLGLAIFAIYEKLKDGNIAENLFTFGRQQIESDGSPHLFFTQDLDWLIDLLKRTHRS